MGKIGNQDGIVAFHNRMRDLDPGGTLLKKGTDGKWPDMNQALASVPVDQWKAIDKHQRTEQILKDDHDAETDADRPQPADDLEVVQGRIFLAGSPLDCLAAPAWMVPVLSADFGNYRSDENPMTDDEILDYLANVIDQLDKRFDRVECWADCRPEGQGTPYSKALELEEEFNLAEAWGQCESPAEFDHAYAGGARTMIGNVSVLTTSQLDKVAKAEVLMTAELYRNVQPWMQPDWRNANDGIGGNCIACYASSSEGANYMSVAQYEADGMYVSGRDSVYGVGLHQEDWTNL